jgi:hypothetical protein
MNIRQWFNSRFLILLAPILILLVSIFIARIPDEGKRLIARIPDEGKRLIARIPDQGKNYFIVGIIVGILFIYQLVIIPELGVVTFLNAKTQFGGNRPFQIKAVQALNSVYDGKSTVLIITGSAQHIIRYLLLGKQTRLCLHNRCLMCYQRRT